MSGWEGTKTLFTTDWHIGADTWGRDRREELSRSIDVLVRAGTTEGVENVVIGGDIFDSFRYPGREDLSFVSSLFASFFSIPSVKRLAVVDGNHDWNDLGVWPDMMFTLSLSGKSFTVAEKPMYIDGGDGWISLVPHLRRHAVRGSFEDTIAPAVPGDSRPVLLCAHMAIEGTMPEMDSGASGEPQMTKKALALYGPSLSGAYFGHIHKTGEYSVGGVPCRYIGTPIRISFGEEKHRNGGWIADFGGGAVHIDVPSRELVTIRASDRREAEAELVSLSVQEQDTPEQDRPYVRIIIESGEKMSAAEISAVAGDFSGSVVVVDSKDREREGTMADFTLSSPSLSGERKSISVGGMLLPYFEENVSDPEQAPVYASIGKGLLEGISAPDLWRAMKENSISEVVAGGEKNITDGGLLLNETDADTAAEYSGTVSGGLVL